MNQTSKKYTIYFYDRSSVSYVDWFANPTQEFWSLDEARIFAQNAADNSQIQRTHSFRIKSDDGKVNEYWSREGGGWKLDN
jgi:hypothetical protein